MTDRLIIFTRYPEPGQVKTRLIPVLGPRGAAELHRRLTMHTLCWAHEFSSRGGVELTVHFDGGDVNLMRKCFGADFPFVPQSSGDLGQRLTDALSDTCAPSIVIGTDCPALTAGHVHIAFAALGRADVVLGPATDGGYYMIGLKSPQPQLFANIPWGTDRVCETTRQHAERTRLVMEMLPTLSDIDRPEDLSQVRPELFDDHDWRLPL